MKHSLTAWLAFVSFAVASGCQAATPGSDSPSKIDQYMHAAVKVQHFMGSILIARDGHVIVAKGYGMASIEHESHD